MRCLNTHMQCCPAAPPKETETQMVEKMGDGSSTSSDLYGKKEIPSGLQGLEEQIMARLPNT